MVACPAHPAYQPTLLRDRKAGRAGLAEGGRVPRRAGPGRQRSASSSHSPAQVEGAVLRLSAAVEGGGAGKATTAARAPVAFFRAPSPIQALDCQGAEIALGCQSGAVLLLRAAVLLT